MKNHEISKILKEAGVKEHRLWDKPRPKWSEYDFLELECIKRGIPVPQRKNEVSVYRKIKRLSDNKTYRTVKEAAQDNNVGLNQIYDHCNGLKEQQKFIYEEETKSLATYFAYYGILPQERG